ncbi:MAG: DUF5011 domain-containing protein [Christensenellaceae bacterium]|jgi:hypothetical protein|nr:DUF5011 domain-containing protein [Christensenellaceae bacterium]
MKIKGILFSLILFALSVSAVLGLNLSQSRIAFAVGPYPELVDGEYSIINSIDSNSDGFLNGLDSISGYVAIQMEDGTNLLNYIRAGGNSVDFILTDSLGSVLPYSASIYNPIPPPNDLLFPEYNTEVRTLISSPLGTTIKYYPYLGRVEISSPYALSVPVEFDYIVRVSNVDPATFDSTAIVARGSLDNLGNNFSIDDILYKSDSNPAHVAVSVWNKITAVSYNPDIDFGDIKNESDFYGLVNYPIVIDGISYNQNDVTITFGGDHYDAGIHELVFYKPYAQFTVTYNIIGYSGIMLDNVLSFQIGDISSVALDLVEYNEILGEWEIVSTSQLLPYVLSNVSYDDGGEVELYLVSNYFNVILFDKQQRNFDVVMNTDILNNTRYIETTTIGGEFCFVYSVTLTPRWEAGFATLDEGLSVSYFLLDSPVVFVSVEYYTDIQPQIIMQNGKISFDTIKGTSLLNAVAAIESCVYMVEDMGASVYYSSVKTSNPVVISISGYNPNAYNTYSGTITWTGGVSNNTCVLNISVIISNHAPTTIFSSVTAGSSISSGAGINAGTTVLGSFVVTDLDGDSTTIFASINVASSSAVLSVSGTSFSLVPNSKFLGTVIITAYAVDSEGLEGAAVTFSVTFVDTAVPTIVFNIASMNSGTLTLNKSKTPTNLRSFIESVSDNVADLLISNVTIDGGDIQTFNLSGSFSVVYMLSDGNGNTAVRTIAVTVVNVVPVVNNIELALSYSGTHDITLQGSDSDGDDLYYYWVAVTWYVDDAGQEYISPPFEVFSITNNILMVKVRLADIKNNLPAVVIFNYEVSDGEVNPRPQAQIRLTFVDDVAPDITLTELPVSFNVGEAPSDFDSAAYFVASDEIDGVIVVTHANITGSVNFELVGTYTLTCTLSDAAGNITSKSVTITVGSGGSGPGPGPGPGPGDGDENDIVLYIILGSVAGALVIAGIVILIVFLVRKHRMRI